MVNTKTVFCFELYWTEMGPNKNVLFYHCQHSLSSLCLTPFRSNPFIFIISMNLSGIKHTLFEQNRQNPSFFLWRQRERKKEDDWPCYKTSILKASQMMYHSFIKCKEVSYLKIEVSHWSRHLCNNVDDSSEPLLPIAESERIISPIINTVTLVTSPPPSKHNRFHKTPLNVCISFCFERLVRSWDELLVHKKNQDDEWQHVFMFYYKIHFFK